MPWTIPTCGAFPALERTCHVVVRGETFYAKSFYASLAAGTLCVILLPLFVTGTASYGAAGKVCYDRSFSFFSAMYLDVDSPNYNPDWDMDASSTQNLFPQHFFNSLSTGVSLFGFGVWLFFSPHQSGVARDLDRTLGSYFAFQWLANILTTALALPTTCTSSKTVFSVGFLLYMCVTQGLSIVGTNLLCHRYLCEKARIMIKLLDDANDPSVKWLEWLEGSLVWEVRSLLFVAVGAPMFLVYQPVGVAIGGLGTFLVLMMDTTFSAVVTVLFLRPIYTILREGGVAVQRSAGYKSLMKTKWMTLFGASLAVLSSTALYINMLLSVMLGGGAGGGSPWKASPYLNSFVFGINLDSMLNDLGMLLACGVLKTASCAALTKYFSTAPAHTVSVVPVPVVTFVPNSQASSTYNPNEVGSS